MALMSMDDLHVILLNKLEFRAINVDELEHATGSCFTVVAIVDLVKDDGLITLALHTLCCFVSASRPGCVSGSYLYDQTDVRLALVWTRVCRIDGRSGCDLGRTKPTICAFSLCNDLFHSCALQSHPPSPHVDSMKCFCPHPCSDFYAHSFSLLPFLFYLFRRSLSSLIQHVRQGAP